MPLQCGAGVVQERHAVAYPKAHRSVQTLLVRQVDWAAIAGLAVALGNPSRLTEDMMGANTAPDDVRFAGALLRPVLEGGPAVWRPGHLVHPTPRVLDAFYSQTCSEVASYKVRHELLDDDTAEPLLLLPRKSSPVVLEAGTGLKGRHPFLFAGLAIEMVEHLLGRLENLRQLTTPYLLVSLALAFLPVGGPVPRLVGRDDNDTAAGVHESYLVVLTHAQRVTYLAREGTSTHNRLLHAIQATSALRRASRSAHEQPDRPLKGCESHRKGITFLVGVVGAAG